ncbi:MAG TPA: hypothetical protein ENI23_13745, partial [bacterium]|nr:hypothetical protein [bacterium]
MNKKRVTKIILVALTLLFIGTNIAQAARTDSKWNVIVGTYLKTISPTGYDILINGLNRYLNFNSISGSTGYGIRDNSGVIECKDSGGSWSACQDGSGGGSGGGAWSTTTSQVPGQLTVSPNNTDDIVVIGSNSTTTGEWWFDPNVNELHIPTGLSILGGGFTSQASSTIDGSLTITGNATTTNATTTNLYVSGSVRIATSSIASAQALSVGGTIVAHAFSLDPTGSSGFLTDSGKADGIGYNIINRDGEGIYIADGGNIGIYADDQTQFDGTVDFSQLTLLTTGFTGIQNTTPTYDLDVTGLIHATGLIDASHFVATSSSLVSLFEGGFISSASSTINSNLNISGALSASSTLAVNGTSTFSALGLFDNGLFTHASSTILASQFRGLLKVSSTTSETYQTLQDFANNSTSNGVTSGGALSDGGSGTLNVAVGTVMIRSSNSTVADLFFADFPGTTTATLIDGSLNFVTVAYNSGTPIIEIKTTPVTDPNSNIILGTAYRDGNDVHISNITVPTSQAIQKLSLRLGGIDGLTRKSGALISETGTLNIVITAGSWWVALNEVSTAATDTSGAGTFTLYWDDNAGGFTASSSSTVIEGLFYDDGDGTLGSLGNGKYGTWWVWQQSDDSVSVIYGTTFGSLATAESANAPTNIPGHLTGPHSALVGKIIVKKGDSTFTDILSPFTSTFVAGTAGDHADLINLAWTSSGHSGTANTVPYLGASGEAQEFSTSTFSFIATASSTVDSTLTITGSLTLDTALTVANGGTGASTFTNNRLLTGNGTSAIVDEANLTFDGSTLTVTGNADVTSSVQATHFIADSASATSTFAGGLTIETSGFVYDFSSNNIGIDTASPQELLHVGAGTNASDISATDLLVTRAGPSNLSVRDSTNGVETFLFASSVGGVMGTVTNDPLDIKTNNTSAIFIDASQNVGIGTTSPSSLLSVGNTNGINFRIATSTFSSTGGIDLESGCFAIAGTCVSGAVTSIIATANETTVSGATGDVTIGVASTLYGCLLYTS